MFQAFFMKDRASLPVCLRLDALARVKRVSEIEGGSERSGKSLASETQGKRIGGRRGGKVMAMKVRVEISVARSFLLPLFTLMNPVSSPLLLLASR